MNAYTNLVCKRAEEKGERLHAGNTFFLLSLENGRFDPLAKVRQIIRTVYTAGPAYVVKMMEEFSRLFAIVPVKV